MSIVWFFYFGRGCLRHNSTWLHKCNGAIKQKKTSHVRAQLQNKSCVWTAHNDLGHALFYSDVHHVFLHGQRGEKSLLWNKWHQKWPIPTHSVCKFRRMLHMFFKGSLAYSYVSPIFQINLCRGQDPNRVMGSLLLGQFHAKLDLAVDFHVQNW